MLQSTPKSFARGSVDTFSFTCPALGEPQRLTVGHDNTGDSPSWHLHKASVRRASGHLGPCCPNCMQYVGIRQPGLACLTHEGKMDGGFRQRSPQRMALPFGASVHPFHHPVQAVVTCLKTGAVTEFPCDRWLASGEEDGCTVRALAWPSSTAGLLPRLNRMKLCPATALN